MYFATSDVQVFDTTLRDRTIERLRRQWENQPWLPQTETFNHTMGFSFIIDDESNSTLTQRYIRTTISVNNHGEVSVESVNPIRSVRFDSSGKITYPKNQSNLYPEMREVLTNNNVAYNVPWTHLMNDERRNHIVNRAIKEIKTMKVDDVYPLLRHFDPSTPTYMCDLNVVYDSLVMAIAAECSTAKDVAQTFIANPPKHLVKAIGTSTLAQVYVARTLWSHARNHPRAQIDHVVSFLKKNPDVECNPAGSIDFIIGLNSDEACRVMSNFKPERDNEHLYNLLLERKYPESHFNIKNRSEKTLTTWREVDEAYDTARSDLWKHHMRMRAQSGVIEEERKAQWYASEFGQNWMQTLEAQKAERRREAAMRQAQREADERSRRKHREELIESIAVNIEGKHQINGCTYRIDVARGTKILDKWTRENKNCIGKGTYDHVITDATGILFAVYGPDGIEATGHITVHDNGSMHLGQLLSYDNSAWRNREWLDSYLAKLGVFNTQSN